MLGKTELLKIHNIIKKKELPVSNSMDESQPIGEKIKIMIQNTGHLWGEGPENTCWGTRNILYTDVGSGYLQNTYICVLLWTYKNNSTCTLKIYVLFCIKSYLKFKNKKNDNNALPIIHSFL